MQWHLQHFAQLSPTILYHVMQLRSAVFVVEQNCVYLDADGVDVKCYHLYTTNKNNQLIAYCRIAPPHVIYPGNSSIGRVVIHNSTRGTGIGKLLMAQAIHHTVQLYPTVPILIGAQAYLTKFYTNLGFVVQGNTYIEDGIPHIKMLYTPCS